MQTPRLELSGIRKVYPAVVANDGIDLRVMPGEIHAVLGENGAGKSTLMKIIYGIVKPDEGRILWEGRPVAVASPAQARQLGIGMVFQHFSLFETLTVAQNIALAVAGKRRLKDLTQRIVTLSERYGLPLDPRRHVHALSVGERQRVEIVRCLLQSPKLLIMDEPTSVLAPQAVQALFGTLRQLATEGCSILYISHKLDEIKALCHTATVISAGRVTGTCDPATESTAAMARMMIGRDIPAITRSAPPMNAEPRLAISHLTHRARDPFGTHLDDISITVASGEIVGIAGASGNGQRELLAVLCGEETVSDARTIELCAIRVGRLGPARRRELGMCFVPEERLGRGAVPRMSLSENALLTASRQGMVRRGLIDDTVVRTFTQRCISNFAVTCGGPSAPAKSLSGGNLQKFIVGREVMQEPSVLLLAQPTWGVDVGAAAAIRQAIVQLRARGVAVLIVSEELDELFEICDRIAVIAKGRLSPAKPVSQTSVEEIGMWMSGLWPGAQLPERVDAVSA
ncbi:MAG TPA: ABC transporter ATP-binding protein [Candidatus Acidoferrales bacterium]|nr:ABC transporter ATP-binding protein [Candidatus Acidoferrales bacterium]